jgi:deazaflavin-dependent oxidoreductase (nitroreductase family)
MEKRQLRPPSAQVFITLYAIGLGPLVGRLVLLLTTTGRKSGLPRVTALQYEEIDGEIYLGSSKGIHADWVRNIHANPQVKIRVKNRRFTGQAEVVTDCERIADFMELRMQRHPRMIGMIMKSQGLPEKPGRAELLEYSRKIAMVIFRPV